ncbi:NEK protein kinase [Salpingoeca rosetta]|uniref:non-specific serine/threonine protein kinase n=1 Tax=Salpingoeca rosetta (strain ATCC 50818 / BSB-021) TaxID=946362 RepID=F2U6E6_SALR5|nr:NEK protein kinase [Salpingoeca rosetta]EGD83087.1 NEK protein kinase [Salpingoeca rosetta]|eukprot:XP_004995451.1 NEK protein kinase [Salpingoeca rosetta]
MSRHQVEALVRELGKGAFAKVYLVKAENHAGVIACKRVQIAQLSEEKRAKVMKEVNILRGLQHPHIVRLYESFETGDVLHMHMEYVDGIDLGQLLKKHKTNNDRFSQATVMRWFSQLCYAVEYVHSHNIIHRDIKPTNCFLELDQDIVKLGDFGLSQHIPWYHPRSTGFVGTPYYMSPDVLNGLDYTAKADVWSLAVLLYEMLTLHRPFRAENLDQLKAKVRKREFNPLSSKYASAEVRHLFNIMLVNDEQDRPSSSEVTAHPCVATAFAELHPFHRQSHHRSTCRGQAVECHIAIMQSKKVPDISDLIASRADSVSLAQSPASVFASSGRKASFVNIGERAWRRARLIEKGSHFVVKRSLKTLLKFPYAGDRVFRAASQGHPHLVIVVRKDMTFALSLPHQQLLEPFLRHLDAEPTVRAGVPTQVDTFVRVYDRADKSWTRVYMVSWRSHLFLGAYHLSLHQTEVLPASSVAFSHWLPSTSDGSRIVLRTLDQGVYYMIADSPRAARNIVLCLQLAGCLSVWRTKVTVSTGTPKRRSFSSSVAESRLAPGANGRLPLSRSVGGYSDSDSATTSATTATTGTVGTTATSTTPRPPRPLSRSSSRFKGWSSFRRSVRETQLCTIELFSPPKVEPNGASATLCTYRLQVSPAEFRKLSRRCAELCQDAPVLRRRRSSQMVKEEQLRHYMEIAMQRDDCREFWLDIPELQVIARVPVFEDDVPEERTTSRRRSVKWSEVEGEVSVV